MFFDSDVEVVGFDSCPDPKRSTRSVDSETKSTVSTNRGCQTVEVSTVGIQVAREPENFNKDSVIYDEDKLAAFLKKIMPHLEEELKDSVGCGFDLNFCSSSQAIFNSNLITESKDVVETDSKQIFIEKKYFKDKIVSSLSWNCTSSILAVSCSKSNHEDWCTHEASISLYSLTRDKYEKHPPTQTIRTSSCVRTLKFHPHVPSVLAAGLHNGEVLIWDLTVDGEGLLSRQKAEGKSGVHTDAINSLIWKDDRHGMKLVSAARDGKIIFWRVILGNLTFKPENRYIIPANRITSKFTSANEFFEINSISSWPDNESEFLAAVCQSILHCSTKTTNSAGSLKNYNDPTVMSYKPHKGITTCLCCLPNSDLFASSGIDWNIHINKSKMVVPLHIIKTSSSVLGVEWISKVKLASWGCSSEIECHKINISRDNVENNSCSTTSKSYEVSKNITSVAFNLNKKVAVGNDAGVLIVNNLWMTESY